jgi:phage terminase large subunit-like protein
MPIGSHAVYDFTVPKHENYISNGIAHHNTLGVGYEWACHLTGRYPTWWPGKEFRRAVHMWAAGQTNEATRDNVQKILVGPPSQQNMWGTGMIPRDAIVDYSRAQGVPDLLDTLVVKHGGGGDVQAGHSILNFKSYERGPLKWAGPTLDGVWYDEEPPLPIYTEGTARTQARGVFIVMTFTPLLGISDVVKLFFPKPTTTERFMLRMTIHDVGHYTPEQRVKIIAGYPAHERRARAEGLPVLGSGAIFPIDEEQIKCAPFAIPKYWKRIAALDFGSDHPTAVVWKAKDPDTGIHYVYDMYALRRADPITHAALINSRGKWIPVAWPKDGLNETAVGPQLARQYREAGVNMIHEHAQFLPMGEGEPPQTTVSVEAGVTEMLTLMQMGQWKVFSHLNDWFTEFSGYHRLNGKIVKKDDDAMSASRYALMMDRYAISESDLKLKGLDPNRPYNWRAG